MMEEYLMGFDSGFFGVTESQVPLLLWRVGGAGGTLLQRGRLH